MTSNQALISPYANYWKWNFSVDQILHRCLQYLRSMEDKVKKAGFKSLDSALHRWRNVMNMSHYDRLRRATFSDGMRPEIHSGVCFIIKRADDYYRSPECQNRIDLVPEGLHLDTDIKPLYCFVQKQGYEVVDGKSVRLDKDYDQVIGFDNQYHSIDNVSISMARRIWTFISLSGHRPASSTCHLRSGSQSLGVLHGTVSFSIVRKAVLSKVYARKNAQSPYAPMTPHSCCHTRHDLCNCRGGSLPYPLYLEERRPLEHSSSFPPHPSRTHQRIYVLHCSRRWSPRSE